MLDTFTLRRMPLIQGNKTPATVTDDISGLIGQKPSGLWYGAIVLSFSMLIVGVAAASYLIATGIGTWGLNNTVGWAFDITNFVFWIGIGHAAH